MMAEYNSRMNKQLLVCCQQLPAKDLLKKTHSFFPNIIAYWNHLLFGDLILLGRLAENNISSIALSDFNRLPTPKTPHDIYHESLNDIIILREQVDALISLYCHDLTDAECEQTISYQTTEDENITKKVADVTQHLFNHQTHHRGQLTCLLSQLDIDYGCMDLPVVVGEGSAKYL